MTYGHGDAAGNVCMESEDKNPIRTSFLPAGGIPNSLGVTVMNKPDPSTVLQNVFGKGAASSKCRGSALFASTVRQGLIFFIDLALCVSILSAAV